MSERKRTEFEIERDRALVAQLYLQRKKQHEIAEAVNAQYNGLLEITQQQVSYDLQVIKARWIEASEVAITEARAEELAKLDEIERQAWEGWLRSCQVRKETTSEKEDTTTPVNGRGGRARKPKVATRLMVTFRSEDIRDGDPRFLKVMQDCVDRRCQLLGLDAPKKGTVTLDLILAALPAEFRDLVRKELGSAISED